jgi:Xaa-Pro aminopeptidase
MTDRRPARIAALVDSLHSAQVDALLVTSLPNIRYLTGFSGTSALVVATPLEVLLITDFRYQTQVHDEVGELARITIEPQSLWSGLWQQLPSARGRVEVIGFESPHISHRDFQRLVESGSRWQWRSTLDLVEKLRERKDAGEVELISAAVGVAQRALHRVVPHCRPGLTEMGVAGMLEQALRDEGSEGFPFATIVASGPRSALPHARTSTRVLQKGDFLLMDFGAEVGGYCSDITRTFVLGAATAEQREVYTVVRTANERAAGQIRAGMRGCDADALARGYIERCGFGAGFGHGLGHGIGLEVHEAPRLARTAEGVLPPGAVVTVEPGVYRAGWGGVRIEDDVHLAEGGAALLTDFPRELLEIT